MSNITGSLDDAQRPARALSNGKTIVLAEDDMFISRMYDTKLTAAGYTVVIEVNGRDALEKIRQLHPDLMMLDINMPELTGFDVVRALMADDYDFSNSQVIVLTNSADPVNRRIAHDLSLDYLVKAELTPREVLDHINAKLGVVVEAD